MKDEFSHLEYGDGDSYSDLDSKLNNTLKLLRAAPEFRYKAECCDNYYLDRKPVKRYACLTCMEWLEFRELEKDNA